MTRFSTILQYLLLTTFLGAGNLLSAQCVSLGISTPLATGEVIVADDDFDYSSVPINFTFQPNNSVSTGFLITDENYIVREVITDPSPLDLSAFSDEEVVIIWAFTYTGELLVQPGQSAFGNLATGCFNISSNCIMIVQGDDDGGSGGDGGGGDGGGGGNPEPCMAEAGTVLPVSEEEALDSLSQSVEIAVTLNGDQNLPAGYSQLFVLTLGTDLVVQQINETGVFVVTQPGIYRVHSLIAQTTNPGGPDYLDLGVVQIGVTTGFDLLMILMDADICADLDIQGKPILVTTPNIADCAADAGSLIANETDVVLTNGMAIVGATVEGDQVVPTGFELIYVLSRVVNGTLILQATSNSSFFVVTQPGIYRVHTFVAELTDPTDPDYIDPSIIIPGVTTAQEVVDLINTSGVCASINIEGVIIQVTGDGLCSAEAGSSTPAETEVQLDQNGTATIAVNPDGTQVVPPNYEQVYALTFGPTMTVLEINDTGVFTVLSTGDYTVHVLIAEISNIASPHFLDLTQIQFGTTTASELNGQITGAGVCADIDLNGITITVLPPDDGVTCDADSGSVTADANEVELIGGAVSAISATADGNQVIPGDFEQTYLLTYGANQIIEGVDTDGEFMVDVTGDYTIHVLVAETTDPASVDFLDLTTIEPGITSVSFLADLINTSGICASLGMNGAAITVSDIICDAEAGSLTTDESTVEMGPVMTQIGAESNGDALVPVGYETVYVLASGPESSFVEFSYDTPNFMVSETGSFTIRTLVGEFSDPSSPEYFNLQPGLASWADWQAIVDALDAAGVCADADETGVTIEVVDDSGGVSIGTHTDLTDSDSETIDLTYHPNPVEDYIAVDASVLGLDGVISSEITVRLLGMDGQVVLQRRQKLSYGKIGFRLPLFDVQAGTYWLQVQSGDAVTVRRVIKL